MSEEFLKMKKSTIDNCKIIELPKFQDNRGIISIIESRKNISFDIKRVYYLHDVPIGSERGGHAHKKLQQLIIALKGSFEITLNDSVSKKTIQMDCSDYGLYLPSMIWLKIYNFTTDTVCLVLASEYYDKNDYIYNLRNYKSLK